MSNTKEAVDVKEKLMVEEADLLQRPEVVKAVEMAEVLRAHCAEHDISDGIFAGVVVDGDGFAQHYHDTGFQRAIDWLLEAQRMSKEALAQAADAVDVPDDNSDEGTTNGAAVASGQADDTGDGVSDLDGMDAADAYNAAAVTDANG